MDVQEVRQLDGYLKKLFGNPNIRVVPKGSDTAEVFVGEDDLGELTVDDEDGERSYNFRMVIQVGNDPSIQPVPTLNAYLRHKFDNENIRVVPRPKKTDSLEVYIGEEFIARVVSGNRERPPVLYSRIADPRRRSGGLSTHRSLREAGNTRHQEVGVGCRRWLARMQSYDQAVDTARDVLPIGQPVARKAEGDVGIADAPLQQACPRIVDALA